MAADGVGVDSALAPVTLPEVARAVWRRKLVALLAAGLVVLSAMFLLTRQEAMYESEATVAFLPSSEAAQSQVFFLSAVDSLLPTYGELVESRTLLDPVAASVSSDLDGDDLDVSATPETGTGILRITASAGSPEEAQAVAAGATAAFVDQVDDGDLFVVETIDEARVPESSVAPDPTLVLAAAALLAVVIGVLAALAWDRLFGRVQTARELEEAGDAPLIGVIPDELSLHENRRVVIGSDSVELHRLEESYRAVANNILFASSDRPHEALMVTGVNPGDGKSTTAANLAVAMSELGTSVLLVDADLRRPVQHEIFGVPNDAGLSSTVLIGADPATLVRRTEHDGVYVVPAGPPLANRAQELRVYIDEVPRFAPMADVVLVDSPPLSAADDVRLLAAGAGGVVMLVRAGSIGGPAVARATQSLARLGANILGTLLTRATDPSDKPSSTYYGYRPPKAPATTAAPKAS